MAIDAGVSTYKADNSVKSTSMSLLTMGNKYKQITTTVVYEHSWVRK